MPAQNGFLLTCNRVINLNANCLCSEACRNECIERMVAVRTEESLHQEYRAIENFEEEHLNDMWDLKVQHIITGYSFYRKCTNYAGLQSFGPSLNHIPSMRNMQQRNRTLIKGIYENWNTIVNNVTHHSMLYVDVRKFSLADLSEAVNFPWVKNYNDQHKPKEPSIQDPSSPVFSLVLMTLGYWIWWTTIQSKWIWSERIYWMECLRRVFSRHAVKND